MRILFLGDLVGRAGRDAAIKALPDLRRRFSVDFTIVNAENAAAGFGLTKKIATALQSDHCKQTQLDLRNRMV